MTALKNVIDKKFFHTLANLLSKELPSLNTEQFIQTGTKDIDSLELKHRIRHTTKVLHQFLPKDYRKSVEILKNVSLNFNGLPHFVFPDYVGQYGLEDFDYSLESLKFFTERSTSEFAVREFLRVDFDKTLSVMKKWSTDKNYHVRRLSSEGCRPRLPWSFQLKNLIKDPSPVVPILENLKADEELYVRKSVANHLNDISKDHPQFVLDLLKKWDLTNERTAWIAKQATRTLIKKCHPGSFALLGFNPNIEIEVEDFKLSKKKIQLGESITFSFVVRSTTFKDQKLSIDYVVHYVKKSGKLSPKVFKLKNIELAGKDEIKITKKHNFKNFTTRVHYEGEHKIEIVINGKSVTTQKFNLIINDV